MNSNEPQTADAPPCLDRLVSDSLQYPMREWISKIRTDFNDGSSFEGNEVQHALVVSFTGKARGGVKQTVVIERKMVVDWEEYDRLQESANN